VQFFERRRTEPIVTSPYGASTASHSCRIDAFGLQFGDGLMGRPTAVERDLLRDLMIADRFLEEAYGSRSMPILTQQEIDCLILLIDRAVEIAPLTFPLKGYLFSSMYFGAFSAIRFRRLAK